MNVKEFSELTRTPIEVKSGFNGKVLCKRYDAKKHIEISDREIISIWAEIKVLNPACPSYAHSVICVYVHGGKEYDQKHGVENNDIKLKQESELA